MEDGTDGTTMAEKKSGDLMPITAGQPRLSRITETTAHITIMPAHIEWNGGPHETE
jgi:hypothetical protein